MKILFKLWMLIGFLLGANVGALVLGASSQAFLYITGHNAYQAAEKSAQFSSALAVFFTLIAIVYWWQEWAND